MNERQLVLRNPILGFNEDGLLAEPVIGEVEGLPEQNNKNIFKNSYRAVRRWWYKGYVEPQAHNEMAEENTDEDGEGPDDYQNRPILLENVPRMAKRFAVLARMELSLTNHTEDQVIQCKEWIVREAKRMNVRRCDIQKMLPFAVKLAFLETREERLAREMTLSDTYSDRFENTIGEYHSRRPRTLINFIFGAKKNEVVARRA